MIYIAFYCSFDPFESAVSVLVNLCVATGKHQIYLRDISKDFYTGKTCSSK
jgi:hypothetical protein